MHLQFRRYAGCPYCNLHLRSIVARNHEITAAGIREVVVFHSTAQDLLKYNDDIPLAVVPDPDKRLYREFGVESSPRAARSPRLVSGHRRGDPQAPPALRRPRVPDISACRPTS